MTRADGQAAAAAAAVTPAPGPSQWERVPKRHTANMETFTLLVLGCLCASRATAGKFVSPFVSSVELLDSLYIFFNTIIIYEFIYFPKEQQLDLRSQLNKP